MSNSFLEQELRASSHFSSKFFEREIVDVTFGLRPDGVIPVVFNLVRLVYGARSRKILFSGEYQN